MSYRHSITEQLYADRFTASVVSGYPIYCTEHLLGGRSNCFLLQAPWGFNGEVTWRLTSRLNLPTLLPGQNKSLVGLSVDGSYGYDSGTIGLSVLGSVVPVGDGSKLVEPMRISHDKDRFVPNSWTWNDGAFPLDDVTSLDFEVYQKLTKTMGNAWFHAKNLIAELVYYDEVPPKLADVEIEVTDEKTDLPLPDVRLALMSGTRIVTTPQYTNQNGYVIFTGVEEGTYSLKYSKSGYDSSTESVKVEAPGTFKSISMVPLEGFDWMAWLQENWYIPVGVGAGVLMLLLLWPKSPITIISPQRAE